MDTIILQINYFKLIIFYLIFRKNVCEAQEKRETNKDSLTFTIK